MYIILYIQPTQFFKKYIKLCTLHVHIIQRMYRIVYIFQNCIRWIYKFLYIQSTQFSKNVANFEHSIYTFFKQCHKSIHSTYTIL